MTTWAHDALFYHVYPLGLRGPATGDPTARPCPALSLLVGCRTAEAGVTALYRPGVRASSHGYDTVDYAGGPASRHRARPAR
jgi:hypothetical protein